MDCVQKNSLLVKPVADLGRGGERGADAFSL